MFNAKAEQGQVEMLQMKACWAAWLAWVGEPAMRRYRSRFRFTLSSIQGLRFTLPCGLTDREDPQTPQSPVSQLSFRDKIKLLNELILSDMVIH